MWLQIPQTRVAKSGYKQPHLFNSLCSFPAKLLTQNCCGKWLNMGSLLPSLHLLNPSIFKVAYTVLKADNDLVTRRINCIFPKLKAGRWILFSRIIFKNSVSFQPSLLFVEYICFDLAPRTTAVPLYLNNLKHQLVLAMLIRTPKDGCFWFKLLVLPLCKDSSDLAVLFVKQYLDFICA